jgi:nucleoside-diphosphate-sugar epimerase
MSGQLKEKRILITGGTGFIGSAIARRLLQEGHKIRILDNNSRGDLRRLTDISADCELIEGDVRDAAVTAAAVRDIDSVYHLAYVNGTEFFYSHPELVLDVAVKGMVNVLEACRHENVRELVLASSSEVYQMPPEVPTDESAPLVVPDVLNPRYSYGGGKIISELMAINYGRNGFDRVVIFRPHNIYGPDMGWEHVIPQFALRLIALSKRHPAGTIPMPIQGTGKETRAFCHIDDFVEGVMAIEARGEHLGIYHIGTDEERTIATLATMVASVIGREVRTISGELQRGSVQRRCPDISRLREIGYKPAVRLEDGISSTVAWYAENAHLAPNQHQEGQEP